METPATNKEEEVEEKLVLALPIAAKGILCIHGITPGDGRRVFEIYARTSCAEGLQAAMAYAKQLGYEMLKVVEETVLQMMQPRFPSSWGIKNAGLFIQPVGVV